MTQTLTTETIQEIYEAAVHVEATLNDPDAEFDLYCKLDEVGGVEATIRKLIDMVRAANREARPVAASVLRDSARYQFLRDKDAWGDDDEPGLVVWDGLIDLEGNEFDAAIDARMAHSDIAYTAPPAPAVPDSVLILLNHIEDVLDDENWNRISVDKWNAVTMLAAAPEGGNDA